MLPENVKLYNPIQEVPPKCLVELKMLAMSQEIRSKPDWSEKVMKPEIVAKWRKEAEKQELSSEAVDYVIDEVKYLATLKEGNIEPGPVQGTWMAEKLIDEATLARFKKHVEPLEAVPEEKKDYHPDRYEA